MRCDRCAWLSSFLFGHRILAAAAFARSLLPVHFLFVLVSRVLGAMMEIIYTIIEGGNSIATATVVAAYTYNMYSVLL